ncbi:hypothetical protein CRE_22514 [Caenorhabditis remanei]|uniref:RING-type domain-containing protein n=1 Tax=Caenorhabditis remanei TaxID=31234 RepID=E3MU60_CAERE|nr:hypothetical protein CRE_22514 [Caenorhabditis remanei]
MSKFLKTNDDFPTPACFLKESNYYVLEESRDCLEVICRFPFGSCKGKEERLIEMAMEDPSLKLRMYGSPSEFLENLKIYRNFSGNSVFFNTDDDPYHTTPIIYRSLKNERYICKSDLFSILQNMSTQNDPCLESTSIVAFFLRNLEENLENPDEMVRFDEEMLEEINKELKIGAEIGFEKSLELSRELFTLNSSQIIEKFKALAPEIWNDENSLRLKFLVENAFHDNLTAMPRFYLGNQYSTASSAIKSIRKLINNRSNLFDRTVRTVRMFEDGTERFVMKAELYDVTGDVSLKSDDKIHVLHTMSMQEVMRNYGHLNIEVFFNHRIKYAQKTFQKLFIRYPILRAKHRAVPIRKLGSVGPLDFYVLAVDAFFELFRSIILGAKMFQKIESFEEFSTSFREIEKDFMVECKTPFFIRHSLIEHMKLKMKFSSSRTAKEVRNAKKDGFTVQNLKNELKHLGLVDTFPEIEEHAEVVFKHVDSVKKEKFLRTSDLFDAVEQCQLICVLNRIPNLKIFLHNQKGCGRVLGYECEHCEKEKDDQKPLKNLKIESSNSSISNQYSQPALSTPNDCEKCSESSKTLTETQSELKMSKDQLKEMEKKVLDTEKELSEVKKENEKIVQSEAKKTEELAEMKEELRKEKAKNQEKEEEILKASKENEELEKAILKLTAENQANERVIQKLLDRISNLSTNNQKTNRINEKTIDESTPIASVTSKNAPLIIDCLICSSQIKSGQEVIRCPLCKRRFHSNCAFKWRKDHTQCPACNGDLPGI